MISARGIKLSSFVLYCGYTLYLCFSFMVIHSNTVLSSFAHLTTDTQALFLISNTAAKVLIFILVAALFGFVSRLSNTVLAAITAVVAIGGFLVSAMVFHFSAVLSPDMFMPWLLLGAGLLGVGEAGIVLLWAKLSSTLELRAVYLFVLLCNLSSLILYFLVTFLPSTATLPLAAALFTASVILARRALGSKQEQTLEDSRPVFTHVIKGLTQPIIGTAILFFMSGLMGQISRQQELPLISFQHVSLATTAIVVLCLLLPALLIKKPFNIVRVFSFAIPLSAAGFLLLPVIWSSAFGIVNSFAQLGSMVAGIVLWCLLAGLAKDTKLPAIKLFAIALSCTHGALLAGTIVGFINYNTLQQGDVALTVIALLAAYSLFMATIFLFKDKSFRLLQKQSNESDDKGLTALSDQSNLILLRKRCEHLARHYKLTQRESEIFTLLAQGYTVVVISEKLFVSENTTKSHAKSIYKKLGTHTRSDLIEMVYDEYSILHSTSNAPKAMSGASK